jgi:RNA polymerase sigma factor (sigma-70 family)
VESNGPTLKNGAKQQTLPSMETCAQVALLRYVLISGRTGTVVRGNGCPGPRSQVSMLAIAVRNGAEDWWSIMITNGLVTRLWMSPRRHSAEGTGGGDAPDETKTSPNLLDRVRNWRDHPAWAEFFERYDPMLHRWCGRFALDGDAADELCQRIWFELMGRMRTFRYDPSRGFRKWLWRLFWSRAIDLLRRRRATAAPSYEDVPPSVLTGRTAGREPAEGHESEEPGASLVLVHQAEEAQAAVRTRVDPDTWRAYWLVAIEDRPIREAADRLGKSYTAVYNGYKRVDRMLRAEGERRLAVLLAADPASKPAKPIARTKSPR